MKSQHMDWHSADIVAGLRKKRTSLAAESRRAGLSSSTLANTLIRPWPKGERIIADALGLEPWVIWPSRYHDPITNEFIDKTRNIRKKLSKCSINATETATENIENPHNYLDRSDNT